MPEMTTGQGNASSPTDTEADAYEYVQSFLGLYFENRPSHLEDGFNLWQKGIALGLMVGQSMLPDAAWKLIERAETMHQNYTDLEHWRLIPVGAKNAARKEPPTMKVDMEQLKKELERVRREEIARRNLPSNYFPPD